MSTETGYTEPRAEQAEALHRSSADPCAAFEGAQIAAVLLDGRLTVRDYTQAVTPVLNLVPGDRGRPIADIAHRLEGVDLMTYVRKALEERRSLERPVRRGDGKASHLMRVVPYRASAEDNDGALIIFVDVSATVAAEEHQRLLAAELNHRVRNMLQVVIGLAHQTLHRSQTLADFEQDFMGRIQALARAYDLLSHDGWSSVAMSQLVSTQLDAFATAGQRYASGGDRVMLTAGAALSLGLIVYELATNATKYGALSSPDGKVDISWQLTGKGQSTGEGGVPDRLLLVWQESGGPAVQAPRRSGFGTELVQRQLHYELNGTASMDFEPAGLRVTLEIPTKNVVAADRP